MSKNNTSDDARKQIDENLKRVFQEELDAELPAELKDLLEKLRQQDPSGQAGGDS